MKLNMKTEPKRRHQDTDHLKKINQIMKLRQYF